MGWFLSSVWYDTGLHPVILAAAAFFSYSRYNRATAPVVAEGSSWLTCACMRSCHAQQWVRTPQLQLPETCHVVLGVTVRVWDVAVPGFSALLSPGGSCADLTDSQGARWPP